MNIPNSYRDLAELLPPPREPVTPPAWDHVPTQVGLRLPADYKWFCDTYGGGVVAKPSESGRGAWLEIFSPSQDGHGGVPGGLDGLIGYHMRHFHAEFTYDGAEDDMWAGDPRPVFPDSGGVLGWGQSEWGDSLFWLTGDPDPNEWPVVAWMRNSGEPVYPGCGMIDFMLMLFNGEVAEMRSWIRPGLQWTMRNDWLQRDVEISSDPGAV